MPRVRIIEQYCKGCGLCVRVCPRGALSISQAVNRRGVHVVVVREEVECSGCLNCTAMCPDAALEILNEDKLAQV